MLRELAEEIGRRPQDREQGMVELMGSQIGSQIEIRLGETAT